MAKAACVHLRSLRLVVTGLSIASAVLVVSAQAPADPDARIADLLGQMTLEEKLGQLQQLSGAGEGGYEPAQLEEAVNGRVGSFLNVRGAERVNTLQRAVMERSRLKIPLLLGFDVIHGYRTIFPIPLGESASWDPAAAERSAAIAAAESAAVGLKWTFAPMVDIARDPRWGRIAEGAGEDTFLGMAFARARVRGFQGDDPGRPDRVMACVKHFVGYGAPEGGRDYNTTEISERTLREVYLPPFKAALDAGAGTVMSAFNDLAGLPASGNPFTLTEVLRHEWKFDGMVVSDYNSVHELVNHRLAADDADAAREGLTAGVDMEMVSRTYNEYGARLLQQGAWTMAQVDEAVRRILRTKIRLGLFERPYADPATERTALLTAASRQAAREIAARSFVLLKNERQVLPFQKSVRSIALIGPLGNDAPNMMGNWTGDGRSPDVVTVLAGLKEAAPQAAIMTARGCELTGDSRAGFADARAAAQKADIVVLAIGEPGDWSGEATSRATLGVPGVQLDLVREIAAVGKPTAAVLFNGRPLAIGDLVDAVPTVLEVWYPGTEAGHAIADVLFGDVNPGGKLPVTFPRSVGQVPIYYNHKSTGRPPSPTDKYTSKYIDSPWTPLFPFGFGLSYTTFALRDLRLSTQQIAPDGQVQASVTVANTGSRRGDEVVQFYVQDVASSVTRPVRELRGFQRVTLDPGQSTTVTVTFGPGELGFLDRDMKFVVEPGAFKVWASTSSEGGLEADFTVR